MTTTSHVENKGGHIVLYDDRDSPHCIALHRIDTPEKLVQWLLHLSAKTWVTHRTLWCVAREAALVHGFRIDGLGC